MTRSATLPTGVATEAIAAQYRAVHCVEILYSTPVRVTDGPAAVTIDSNSYSAWQLEIEEMPLGEAGAVVMLRLANTDQSLSTLDLSEDSRGKTVNVYEVFWSAAGAQLSPVKAWSGTISEVLWGEDTIEYSVQLLPGAASNMVGVIAQRLCTHTFRGLRCGYNEIAAPTHSGTPSYATGKRDKALVVTSTTLTVPSAALTASAGTFECWVSIDTLGSTRYIFHNAGSTNNKLELYVNASSKLVCVYGTGSTTKTITSSGAALSEDTWYHVAVTWSASGVTLYQAGSSVGTDATAPSLTSGASMYLGSDSGAANFLTGWLDEVRFSNAVRTSTQIAAEAASCGPMAVETSTKYYLPFDDDLRHAEGTGAQSCDHTYATCTTLTNTTRFGGVARFAPRLGQRVSYQLVRAVGVSVTSGTQAPAPTTPTTTGTVRPRIRSTP